MAQPHLRRVMAEQQESKAGWVRRLAERWGVSPARVGVILLVFALTGFTVMFLKKPMVAWASGDAGDPPLLFTVLYARVQCPAAPIWRVIRAVQFFLGLREALLRTAVRAS